MTWVDIASIVFVCVTMNHLGLIGEIERVIGKRLIVLNCPKCASFWLTFAYGLWGIRFFYGEFPKVLAVSFLASYCAIWLELFEGFIDTIYLKIYEKIYRDSTNDTSASVGYEPDTDSTVSEL